MRIGTKKRPFYRVVVVDERAKRTGAYLELLGTYNPLTEPKDIKLVQDRIDHWIKQGAQMSEGFLRIIGKAPQRPPRKPKKATSAKGSGGPEEKKVETPAAPVEEAPKLSGVETGSAEASADRDSADLQSEAILKIKESDQESQPEVEEKKDEGSA